MVSMFCHCRDLGSTHGGFFKLSIIINELVMDCEFTLFFDYSISADIFFSFYVTDISEQERTNSDSKLATVDSPNPSVHQYKSSDTSASQTVRTAS